jgi:hypothetical protein
MSKARGDFWDETVTKTDRLLREMDATVHPAVRGGERIARALRLAFAKTLPPMQMARAVVVALPDDPERFSAGLAEIKSNMARAFDVLDQDIIAWRAKMERTLSDKVRAAFYNAAPTAGRSRPSARAATRRRSLSPSRRLIVDDDQAFHSCRFVSVDGAVEVVRRPLIFVGLL